MQFLAIHYKVFDSGKGLKCCTEVEVANICGDREIVRCHPNYQSQGFWYDWAIVRVIRPGAINAIVPAKFCSWVQNQNGDVVQLCGEVVHTNNEHTDNFRSVITRRWSFPLVNTQFGIPFYFHCIKGDDYLRSCFVVCTDGKLYATEVVPRETWYNHL